MRRSLILILCLLATSVEAAEVRLTLPDAMLDKVLREACRMCNCSAPAKSDQFRQAADCGIHQLALWGLWSIHSLDDLGADVTITGWD